MVGSALAALPDEPRLFEDFQVLRDGGQRHVERIREVGDAGLAEREPREDGAPRRVGERREGAVERARIVNHPVNNIGRTTPSQEAVL